MAKYRFLAGYSLGGGVDVNAGDVVADLPSHLVRTLLQRGKIEEVVEEDAPDEADDTEATGTRTKRGKG